MKKPKKLSEEHIKEKCQSSIFKNIFQEDDKQEELNKRNHNIRFMKELEKIGKERRSQQKIFDLLLYCGWICLFLELICFSINFIFIGQSFFILALCFLISGMFKNYIFHERIKKKLNKLKH